MKDDLLDLFGIYPKTSINNNGYNQIFIYA